MSATAVLPILRLVRRAILKHMCLTQHMYILSVAWLAPHFTPVGERSHMVAGTVFEQVLILMIVLAIHVLD